MNHIEVKEIQTPYGYKDNYWVIDGRALPEYLNTWALESQDEYLKSIGSFLGLCPAWHKDITWAGDIRFVWKLIEMDSTVLPLLLCEDDLDFSCIVIVVDVEKTKDFVYWKRIGYVLHEKENTDSYSDEDNTLPFYQTAGNVCWIKNTEWVFDKSEYDQMVNMFREMQTIKQLHKFPENAVMKVTDCADMLAGLTSDGKQMLDEHRKEFGEILIHVLAADFVVEPLIDLLKYHMDRKITIQMYCKAIEVMWKNGDDRVRNAVDVTILERLSDEERVWKRFGDFISGEFKNHINNEILNVNLMMEHAKEH